MDKSPSLKILCVDDEPELLFFVTHAATQAGFDVLQAQDGAEALDLIKKNADLLALVISDVVMPKMNGLDLRKAMLPQYKAIPFILASGKVTREEALEALESKISAFLSKPYTMQQVLELIQKESAERSAAIREEIELRDGFVTESLALTEEMEQLLLALEEDPNDSAAMDRIFACAHTIKGTSGFFKPDTIHRFTHRYEDFLSAFKKKTRKLDRQGIDILLKGLDTIRVLIEDLRDGNPNPRDLAHLLLVFEANAPASAEPSPQAQAPRASTKREELRVDLDLLDEFMASSGKLTVLRNMVNKALRLVESDFPANANINTLSTLLIEMHKVNSDIQDHVVSMRKVPLKHVYKPLMRTMRDLSASLKKKFVFIAEGEDLQLDHTLSDALNKCLIHIIRNAADHGIEGPEERKTLGKKPEGRIEIKANQVGEEIVIRIIDDGRGIDPKRIKAKAIEKGLITEAQSATMTESQIRLLIFEPGFSTAEQLTDISGRGVGTDMVKSTIQATGGRIDLQSTIGQGTEFILFLPIPKSVLIVPSLLVRSADRIFAIPQDQIAKVISTEQGQSQESISQLGEGKFLTHESRLIPILSLSKILSLPQKSDQALVILRSEVGEFGLSVEEVLEIEDTVVSQVGRWFTTLPHYLGATFLGDGSVGLILNSTGIARQAGFTSTPHVEAAPPKNEVISDSDHESVLLFHLGTPTRYGVPQKDIFRLEILPADRVQYTGVTPVVRYRSQTMPLIHLQSLIERGAPQPVSSAGLPSRPQYSVLVVRIRDQYKGLVVDTIQDFVQAEKTSSENHVHAQGHTVRMLDLPKLLDALQTASTSPSQ